MMGLKLGAIGLFTRHVFEVSVVVVTVLENKSVAASSECALESASSFSGWRTV